MNLKILDYVIVGISEVLEELEVGGGPRVLIGEDVFVDTAYVWVEDNHLQYEINVYVDKAVEQTLESDSDMQRKFDEWHKNDADGFIEGFLKDMGYEAGLSFDSDVPSDDYYWGDDSLYAQEFVADGVEYSYVNFEMYKGSFIDDVYYMVGGYDPETEFAHLCGYDGNYAKLESDVIALSHVKEAVERINEYSKGVTEFVMMDPAAYEFGRRIAEMIDEFDISGEQLMNAIPDGMVPDEVISFISTYFAESSGQPSLFGKRKVKRSKKMKNKKLTKGANVEKDIKKKAEISQDEYVNALIKYFAEISKLKHDRIHDDFLAWASDKYWGAFNMSEFVSGNSFNLYNLGSEALKAFELSDEELGAVALEYAEDYESPEDPGYEIEEGGHMGFISPDIDGMTILVVTDEEEEVQIDLESDMKIDVAGDSLTLGQVFLGIDPKRIGEVFQQDYDMYIMDNVSENLYKYITDYKLGQVDDYFTFEGYVNVGNSIRWVAPEDKILSYFEEFAKSGAKKTVKENSKIENKSCNMSLVDKLYRKGNKDIIEYWLYDYRYLERILAMEFQDVEELSTSVYEEMGNQIYVNLTYSLGSDDFIDRDSGPNARVEFFKTFQRAMDIIFRNKEAMGKSAKTSAEDEEVVEEVPEDETFKETPGDDDDEETTDEEDVTPDEVIEEVAEEPVEQVINVDILPKIDQQGELESIADVMSVLREYFVELGYEIVEEEDKIIIPFDNRSFVIGVTNNVIEAGFKTEKDGFKIASCMRGKDFALDMDKSLRYMIKQCQEGGKRVYAISDEDIKEDIIKHFGTEYRNEVEDSFTLEVDYFEFKIDGDVYTGYESEDQAYKEAVDHVANSLEMDPDLFDPDWIAQWIKMTDTDRRQVALDLTDSTLDGYGIKDLMKKGDIDNYDTNFMTKSTDDFREDLYKLDKDDYPEGTLDDWTEEEIIDEAIDMFGDDEVYDWDRLYDEVSSNMVDDIAVELHNPVKYLVEETGLYTIGQLLEASNFTYVDYDAAAEDAVDTDGWAHFISHYDDNYEVLANGEVIFRA